MMIFAAANDLLTMFVALEVLVAAAVPDVRAGPAPPAAVAGSGGQVLPARRVRLGVLPLRPGAALRLRGLGRPRRHRDAPARLGAVATSCCSAGSRCCVVGLLFKAGVGAVPHLDAGRLPGRADAGHRVHGGLHQGRRVRRDPAGALRRVRRHRAGTGGRCCGPSPSSSMVVGAVLGLTQTDIKRMLAYSSIAHAGFLLLGVDGASRRQGVVRRRCSTCSPTASPRSPRSACSPWCATPTARPRTCRSGRAWRKRSPVVGGR